jgi:hypothetical protein
MTSAAPHRVYTYRPSGVTRPQVVGFVVVLMLAWWSMVAGSVVVARHAIRRTLSAACTDYGPRVAHGPAQVQWVTHE